MKTKPAEYQQRVKKQSPKSKTLLQCFKAFWVGGFICTLGQLLREVGEKHLSLSDEAVSAFVSITLVFIASALTGIGVYDKIGSYAGAGSVVPITGFSNAITAPAIEFKSEGLVLGVGAKLFTVAGPVLVYGYTSSIIIGLLSLLLK